MLVLFTLRFIFLVCDTLCLQGGHELVCYPPGQEVVNALKDGGLGAIKVLSFSLPSLSPSFPSFLPPSFPIFSFLEELLELFKGIFLFLSHHLFFLVFFYMLSSYMTLRDSQELSGFNSSHLKKNSASIPIL